MDGTSTATAPMTTRRVRPTLDLQPAGHYVASLRVTDGRGGTDTDSVTIGVGRPTVSISTPAPGPPGRSATSISFSGSATDNEGQPIPPLGCRGRSCSTTASAPRATSTRSRPSTALRAARSRRPTTSTPPRSSSSLTATDSHGLKATQSVVLMPRTTTLTLRSNPTGLTLGLQRDTAADAVHSHGHRGLEEHAQRPFATDPRRQSLDVGLLVERQAPGPTR